MPFFKGGQKTSPNNPQKSDEGFPAPPPMFDEDEVFLSNNSHNDTIQPPKFITRRPLTKEKGFKKLIRRHSSKLPRELEPPPSPPSNPAALKNKQGKRLSADDSTHNGYITMDKRSGGSGNKVTFAATLEQDRRLDYLGNGLKKSGKSSKKSKHVSNKAPLPSVLKNPSPSAHSMSPPYHSDNLDYPQNDLNYFTHDVMQSGKLCRTWYQVM